MVNTIAVGKINKFTSCGKVFFCAMPLFLLINNISPLFNLSFSSQRIAFTIFFILNVISIRNLSFRLKVGELSIFLLSIFLIFYSLLVSVAFGSDFIQSSRFFHFFLFSLFGPFLVSWLFGDEVGFHKSIVVATFAQVLFVILTYSSESFTGWLFSYIDSGNQSLLGARAPGLSSSGGAALSVVLSLGALSILRLSDFRASAWHCGALVIIACSAALVGRTGMLVSLMCLFFLIIKNRISVKSALVTVLIIGFSMYLAFDSIKNNPQFLRYTLTWALSVFTGSDHTVSVLLGQDLRELSERVLLFGGVGVSSPEGGNASGSDVGYIQTLYSIGLPFGLMFYLGYFIYLCHFKVNKSNIFFKWLLIFLIFFLELKEPFIFKYAISFYVLASILYMRSA